MKALVSRAAYFSDAEYALVKRAYLLAWENGGSYCHFSQWAAAHLTAFLKRDVETQSRTIVEFQRRDGMRRERSVWVPQRVNEAIVEAVDAAARRGESWSYFGVVSAGLWRKVLLDQSRYPQEMAVPAPARLPRRLTEDLRG